MMRLLKWILCILLIFTQAGVAQGVTLLPEEAYADRWIANPHSVRDIGDPHIIKANDEYFVFATGGPLGFFVWRSTDLNTFTREKAFKKASWASGDYWAPEVYEVDGRYVMFYAARWKETGSLRMGVAFADAPQGPYEDALGAPLFDFGYAVIDGTLIYDQDGTPYMIYSRDCSENIIGENYESHLYGVQLAPDLMSVVGEGVLLTRPDVEWELESGDHLWNEGPFVVEHDGKYYLYYSANYYATEAYSVGVAVADHPMGPYVKQADNPLLKSAVEGDKVLVSGPGHNSFFTAGDELFTVYHTHTYPVAPSHNRQLCIDRAGFHADGTAYINGPTLAPQLRPLQDLGLVNHMAKAVSADPDAALLCDGDACQTSAAYAFTGGSAAWTWDTPVSADMILIYPAQGGALQGEIVLNGEAVISFAKEAGGKPGQAIVLGFEAMDVAQMSVTLSGACGEIMMLGAAK